jgi:hypothetical protein
LIPFEARLRSLEQSWFWLDGDDSLRDTRQSRGCVTQICSSFNSDRIR